MKIVEFTMGNGNPVTEKAAEEIFQLFKDKKWTFDRIWLDWDSHVWHGDPCDGKIKFSFTGISCFMVLKFSTFEEQRDFLNTIETGYKFSDESNSLFYGEILKIIKNNSKIAKI